MLLNKQFYWIKIQAFLINLAFSHYQQGQIRKQQEYIGYTNYLMYQYQIGFVVFQILMALTLNLIPQRIMKQDYNLSYDYISTFIILTQFILYQYCSYSQVDISLCSLKATVNILREKKQEDLLGKGNEEEEQDEKQKPLLNLSQKKMLNQRNRKRKRRYKHKRWVPLFPTKFNVTSDEFDEPSRYSGNFNIKENKQVHSNHLNQVEQQQIDYKSYKKCIIKDIFISKTQYDHNNNIIFTFEFTQNFADDRNISFFQKNQDEVYELIKNLRSLDKTKKIPYIQDLNHIDLENSSNNLTKLVQCIIQEIIKERPDSEELIQALKEFIFEQSQRYDRLVSFQKGYDRGLSFGGQEQLILIDKISQGTECLNLQNNESNIDKNFSDNKSFIQQANKYIENPQLYYSKCLDLPNYKYIKIKSIMGQYKQYFFSVEWQLKDKQYIPDKGLSKLDFEDFQIIFNYLEQLYGAQELSNFPAKIEEYEYIEKTKNEISVQIKQQEEQINQLLDFIVKNNINSLILAKYLKISQFIESENGISQIEQNQFDPTNFAK